MWEYAIVLFILLVFHYDLKYRMIPDAINFFFLFLAIAAAIFEYDFGLPSLLASYVPFFCLNFAFAYLLYRFGVWAGGDVKFFTALMAFMPVYYPEFRVYSAFSVFLTSAILVAPITLLYYLKEILLFRREFRQIFIDGVYSATRGTALAFSALLVVSFFTRDYSAPPYLALLILVSFLFQARMRLTIPLVMLGSLFFLFFRVGEASALPADFLYYRLEEYLSLLILLFFSSLILHLLRNSFRLVSREVLTKPVAISEIREGDIPAETLYLEGGKIRRWSPFNVWKTVREALKRGNRLHIKDAFRAIRPRGKIIIDSLKARGLVASEIKQLKRLRVKQILVKEALPFAPVIAAAFLIHRHLDILRAFGY